MTREIKYRHFGTFGLTLKEARDHVADDFLLRVYYGEGNIDETFLLSNRDSIYDPDLFVQDDCSKKCRVCAGGGASFVHSDIGLTVHKGCIGELEEMIAGFLKDSPTQIVSKTI